MASYKFKIYDEDEYGFCITLAEARLASVLYEVDFDYFFS